MFDNKNFLRILSLVVAIMMWVYVMGEVNPETEEKLNDIEVTFVNTDDLAEKGLAVALQNNITVNVTIKGTRSTVNSTKGTGISATVDVSSCSRGTNVAKIDFNLPEGISLESTTKETVSFKVEKLKEKEVPVKIEFVGTNESSEAVAWAYDIKPETVLVKGAESSIEKVNSVKGTITGNVVSGNEKIVEVDLIPVNKGGEDIKGLMLDTAKAEAAIRLMKCKDVDLKITTENLDSDFVVESITGLDSVKIVGASDIIADMVELQAYVDLSGAKGDCEKEIKIVLPEDVYLYDSENKSKVKIKLRRAN